MTYIFGRIQKRNQLRLGYFELTEFVTIFLANLILRISPMARRLITVQFPQPPARTDDFLVVVPNADAARSFSGKVTTLRRIALEQLRAARWREATPLQMHFALLRAVGIVHGRKNASSIAARYRPDLAAALRSDVDLKALEKACAERTRNFARVAQKYLVLLRKQRAVDPDEVLSYSRKLEPLRKQRILAYGFFRARPFLSRREEYELIDAIAEDESVFFLPAGEGYLFEESNKWIEELCRRNWIIDDAALSFPISQTVGSNLAARFSGEAADDSRLPQAEALRFASAEDEVRGVLAMAKRKILSGAPPEGICIVCRKPELYADAISAASEEIGVPVELDFQIPLSATKTGNFIRLLLDANAAESETEAKLTFDFETTVRLMFHSVVNPRPLEVWIRARKLYPSGIEEWEKVCPDVSKFVLNTQNQTRAEFAAQVLRLIENLDIRGRVAGSAQELRAIEQIVGLLNAYGRQGGTINYAQFAAEIASFLTEIETNFSPAFGGIPVKLPNAIIGNFFDTIFIIGLAEGIHPIQPKETLTIDYFERKQLATQGIHFENAAAIPCWEDITFYYALFSAREAVVLSFPSSIGDTEQIESPYFSRLGVKPVLPTETIIAGEADRLRYLLSRRDVEGEMPPLLKKARHSLNIERRRNSSAEYDEYDGVIGAALSAESFGWSATRLADFGRCPFKWFARYCLGLKTVDEASIELDALTQGSFLHKVLEIAGNKSKHSADFRQAMLENLDQSVAEAEQLEDLGVAHLPAWKLRRSEFLEMLREAIMSEDFIEPDATVLDVEREFAFRFERLWLAGKIDRIDRTNDGIVAIDYKTSSSISKVCNEGGKLDADVQIPVYLEAIKNLYHSETIAAGRYFNLKNGEYIRAQKSIDLGKYIAHIKTEFSGGRFPVRPCAGQEVCRYCEFDAVCRRGVRLQLKGQDVPTK